MTKTEAIARLTNAIGLYWEVSADDIVADLKHCRKAIENGGSVALYAATIEKWA